MKSLRYIIPLALAAFVAAPCVANAEDAPEKPAKKERAVKAPKLLPGLTQEETAKVAAAKAVAAKDSAFLEARKELKAAKVAAKEATGEEKKAAKTKIKAAEAKEQTALQAAMIKADPSVEALLKKVEDAKKAAAEAKKAKKKAPKAPAAPAGE